MDWGDSLRDADEAGVRVQLLCRVLDPRRASRAPDTLLTAAGPGYRLKLARGALDTDVLDGHRADARRLADADSRAAAPPLDAREAAIGAPD